MVASLIAHSLTVSRGPLLVLDSIDVTLAPRRRIGLVGPNGVGKSTLLQTLAGNVMPDRGNIERQPHSASVGVMPQEPLRSPTETVRSFLARRTGVAQAQLDLDASTQALADQRPDADERYAEAFERWMRLGAVDFDARAEEVCSELGLHERLLEQPTATLSGGEAARTSLASLLLSRYDVVLLDEPTNDLDMDGLERLEQWVLNLESPVMVVSHDRTFLQRTITDVLEIDEHRRQGQWFGGGWDAFLAERELARQHQYERYNDYAGKKQDLLDRAQQQREWASQGSSKVRKSSENDKHVRNWKMAQTEQLAGKAARTKKAVDRLEVHEKPFEGWELRFAIPSVERSGDVVADARKATVDRGEFRLGPVDLTVTYGDRIALVGANGSGKSTLIDLLLGRIAPDTGEVDRGRNVKIGEIEQARSHLLGGESLLRQFMDASEALGVEQSVADTRTLLAKFGLGAEHVPRPAGTLSPGERTRASLALLMATGANLLVLDEPTNHLDLAAIEQLEQALDTFEGTVLLVSHDRSMLDRVHITRWIDIEHGLCRERH